MEKLLSALFSVSLHDLTFTWPDGTAAIDRLSGSFGHGSTGLIGANGAGKSTLLRLIAGHMRPTSGTITAHGMVDYLPQRVSAEHQTLSDLLGITAVRSALAAIEGGSVEQAHYDAVGDRWDVEERAVGELAAFGLPTDLDRPLNALSGGEVMLSAITGIRLRGADIALLDEPSNNLDHHAREQLYELIRTWSGVLIVASHDRKLLELMSATAELRAGSLETFGGPLSEYLEFVEVQQTAAQQAYRNAEQALKKEKREQVKAEERIAHSARQGKKDRANKKYPPIVLNARKGAAQAHAGAQRANKLARIEEAKQAKDLAESAIRDHDTVTIDLPDPQVPNARELAILPSSDGRNVLIQGPQRIGVMGANGAGKTTLINELLPNIRVHVGYLRQRIELPEDASVLEFVQKAAPALTTGQVRNRLARLLIRGDMAYRAISTLSGGERFRVALAQILLADPPPDLVILDEPTNDLDMASVDQLIAALAAYRGGLLVVSHDHDFLGRLGLDTVYELHHHGQLCPIALATFP